MALADDTRGKREYDKFVADGTGNTGLRVITSSKVYGSLQTSPGVYGATKYTQIGDNIEVTASNDSAYKSIATTPLKHVLIHAKVPSSNADCQVFLVAD
jgi:hypothetical protein